MRFIVGSDVYQVVFVVDSTDKMGANEEWCGLIGYV